MADLGLQFCAAANPIKNKTGGTSIKMCFEADLRILTVFDSMLIFVERLTPFTLSQRNQRMLRSLQQSLFQLPINQPHGDFTFLTIPIKNPRLVFPR